MIEIADLAKTYGRGTRAAQALRGIDLRIPSGMFGLLGPNGAGKTTLMRILAGIINPSRGAIRVEGHDLTTESGKRGAKAILGYLPQRPTEPEQGLTIVSMLHLTDGIQYRLVGPSVADLPTAETARPSLEDGYVWLMKGVGQG